MHTWFHAQLDQKILEGIYCLRLWRRSVPAAKQSRRTLRQFLQKCSETPILMGTNVLYDSKNQNQMCDWILEFFFVMKKSWLKLFYMMHTFHSGIQKYSNFCFVGLLTDLRVKKDEHLDFFFNLGSK